MTTLELFTAGALTAAAADAPEPRVAEGIVVPYDRPGRTNLGPKRIRPGALHIVAESEPVGLYGHDRDRAVSFLEATEERADGLWGRLRVADTPDGDLLLREIRAKVRRGLSVELSDLVFDSTDPDLVVSARLDAVAHVPLPAYDTARVTALAATQHQGEPSVTSPSPVAAPAAPALDYAQLAAALAPHLTAAAVPGGLPTGALSAAPAATAPTSASPGLAPSQGATPTAESDPIGYAATLMAAVQRNTATPEMRAELVDITSSGLPMFQNRSTLGEKLWEGAGYSRRFTSKFRQKQLTDQTFTGWQWVERPRVQNYLGDKKDVPSNPVSVVAVQGKARRLAGAWDIDRAFVDFDQPEFWAEFWAAGTESYLEESDLRAAQALVDYAIDLTDPADYPTLKNEQGNTVYTYALPAGYATGAGGLVVEQTSILNAAALATAILEDTPRVKRAPDYIVMNTADWLSLTTMTSLDLPAFLALLKVSPENFERSSLVPQGTIIAGVTQAATYRELGSTPIRVEALDIAHGGVDRGLFGYTGISMDRPGGIISLPLAPAAG